MPIHIENSVGSRSSTIDMVRNIYIYIYMCVGVYMGCRWVPGSLVYPCIHWVFIFLVSFYI